MESYSIDLRELIDIESCGKGMTDYEIKDKLKEKFDLPEDQVDDLIQRAVNLEEIFFIEKQDVYIAHPGDDSQ